MVTKNLGIRSLSTCSNISKGCFLKRICSLHSQQTAFGIAISTTEQNSPLKGFLKSDYVTSVCLSELKCKMYVNLDSLVSSPVRFACQHLAHPAPS